MSDSTFFLLRCSRSWLGKPSGIGIGLRKTLYPKFKNNNTTKKVTVISCSNFSISSKLTFLKMGVTMLYYCDILFPQYKLSALAIFLIQKSNSAQILIMMKDDDDDDDDDGYLVMKGMMMMMMMNEWT